jgi:diamine N-acetyltransferase
MEIITVRKVTLKDISDLQEIGRKTFSETFAERNTEEDMAKYLDESFSIEKLSHELDDNDSEFYFAISSQQVIGYLKLNVGKAQTELKDGESLEIERIYVLREYHGKGVGQVLYDKALQVAKQKQMKYIWLGVWEENPRATRFYQKNGFVAFGKHIFKLGDDEQTDILMRRPL